MLARVRNKKFEKNTVKSWLEITFLKCELRSDRDEFLGKGIPSFSSVASDIWNALPNHLSFIQTLPAFRRALKHHQFLLAYPDSSAKPGRSNQLNVSHFVIQRQLLPPHSPEIPCRPSKGVPSERLRLVVSTRLWGNQRGSAMYFWLILTIFSGGQYKLGDWESLGG